MLAYLLYYSGNRLLQGISNTFCRPVPGCHNLSSSSPASQFMRRNQLSSENHLQVARNRIGGNCTHHREVRRIHRCFGFSHESAVCCVLCLPSWLGKRVENSFVICRQAGNGRGDIKLLHFLWAQINKIKYVNLMLEYNAEERDTLCTLWEQF